MPKKRIYLLTALLMVILLGASPVNALEQEKKRSIEVAFVLDTTGSMGGLIEGAKLKIWSIANEMVSAKPTPDLKMALIGYRDRKDAYITKLFDLSDDLDAMYQDLQAFQAMGGDDTPESVNQALHEAVTKISWSRDRDVLKVIFLVGDAPPHMDYQDDVKYPKTCQLAVKKDIIINSIQCGNMSKTTPFWKEIARLSEGKFVQIGQTGDMVAMETPMDEELEKLNKKLGKTAIGYGKEEERLKMINKMRSAEAAPRAAKADRMTFMSKSKSKKVVTGDGDLVTDMDEGKVNMEKIKEEELPREMKNMKPKEREAYVKKKSEERKIIQADIDKLLKKRQEYIKAEQAKKGKKDTFDEKVGEMIRKQAKKKGIVYTDK